MNRRILVSLLLLFSLVLVNLVAQSPLVGVLLDEFRGNGEKGQQPAETSEPDANQLKAPVEAAVGAAVADEALKHLDEEKEEEVAAKPPALTPGEVATNSETSTLAPKAMASSPFANLRTLVIVQGNLRGGEIPWRTLKNHVLDYNPNTDLALFIGDTNPLYQNSSLFQWAKYSWKFPEYEDWGVPLDETFGTEWRQTIRAPLVNRNNPNHVKGNMLGGIKGTTFGSGAVQFMIRYWLYQKILENGLLEKYDQFVVTRTDHYYMCPHDLSVLDTNNHMYVPLGQDYAGINDRHLVVGKNNVLAALDWFPHVLKHYKEYPLAQSGTNTEKMLMTFWQLTGLWDKLKRTNRIMFVGLNPNGKDHTRTRSASSFEGMIGPEGVGIKYKKEYLEAQRTCKA